MRGWEGACVLCPQRCGEKEEGEFAIAGCQSGSGAGAESDVEDDAIVPRVQVMPVSNPVAGVNMHLDVPAEKKAADADERIGKVRTAVVVRRPGRDDGDRLAVGGAQPLGAVEPVFPEVSEVVL